MPPIPGGHSLSMAGCSFQKTSKQSKQNKKINRLLLQTNKQTNKRKVMHPGDLFPWLAAHSNKQTRFYQYYPSSLKSEF